MSVVAVSGVIQKTDIKDTRHQVIIAVILFQRRTWKVARMIDKNELITSMAWHDQQGMISSIDDVLDIIEAYPTLTQPNEWISVGERLPEPDDLIVYADNTVWGYQYGICRVCGKEKAFDYWIPLQDPPNNRPPEGEET